MTHNQNTGFAFNANVKGEEILEDYIREWIDEWGGMVTGDWIERTDIPDNLIPFVKWACETRIKFLDIWILTNVKR